ncbi:Short-chain dehydrogenase/reductase family protein [Mycena chlorophos]|uniref:Short-chain dehydrogenase/reductase family protein n=1 Tax=Mycena chlorophos TaxID=658473 RepID=A0A8H6SMR9_MYCCL|nr:Short-chain dehydrogenase/reductase family protein [Mycena chlorophos]
MSFPTFTAKTTATEVAETFAEQIKGKTVLVTGTSINGLGFATARAFAKYAGLVVITGRSSSKLKESEEALQAEFPQANVRPLVLDLASRASVRKAAAEVNAYAEPLHILINNAIAPIGPFVLNEDNLESQFSLDHVSPFLFTKLLAPKLLASTTPNFVPRVIFVSSAGHLRVPGLDWDVLAHPDPAKHDAAVAYCQAKVANVLAAKELTKRSNGKIQSFSLHPGTIATGENPVTVESLIAIGIYTADGKPNLEAPVGWKSRDEGAATTVAAAIDPRLEGKGGAYLVDSVIADDQVSAFASDSANATRLWDLTEELIGEKFTF